MVRGIWILRAGLGCWGGVAGVDGGGAGRGEVGGWGRRGGRLEFSAAVVDDNVVVWVLGR